MKFDFTLNKADYLSYYMYSFFVSRQDKPLFSGMRLWFSILYIIMGIFFYYKGTVPSALLLFCLAILWFMFFPYIEKKRYKVGFGKFLDRNMKDRYGKKIVFSMDNQKLSTETEWGNSEMEINDIVNITEVANYYFMLSSDGEVLIIPKKQLSEKDNLRNEIIKISKSASIDFVKNLDWI